MHPPLHYEPLAFDADGHPWSARYGDVYASRDGALGQARHVFLAGNDLPARWGGRRQFVILETGFGLGTNFLATWQAWRADPRRPRQLHFVSLELHPVSAADQRTLAQHPGPAGGDAQLRALRQRLAERWPLPLAGLHRLEFEEPEFAGRVVLTLGLGDARVLAPALMLGADAFYLDGFAPDRNPQLWEPQLLRDLARLARPGATLASYSCARPVREGLASHGFEVELRPGYASKREMLVARFAPRWKVRRHEPPQAYPDEERAIVVGAGLAGCSVAYLLRRRGWKVTLLDGAAAPAAGASSLPAGLLQPLLSADDNLVSQLTRAGFLYLRGLLERIAASPTQAAAPSWAPCGVLHQALDESEAQQWRERLGRQGLPESYARFVEAAEAAQLAGMQPHHGGVWFAGGGVVSAARWCHALLAAAQRPAGLLECVFGYAVRDLQWVEGQWQARDAAGRVFAAPVLVLANAGGLGAFPGLGIPALQEIPGRISLLPPGPLAHLRAGISGNGYLIPPLLGQAAVGATYEDEPLGSAGSRTDAQAHESNLARLASLVAQPLHVVPAGSFGASRCVAPDRMPLAGAIADADCIDRGGSALRGAHLEDLPRRPGLFCLAALGSRGLALAGLLGEAVAAQAAGDPLPLTRTQAGAVDPGRFLLRGLR